MRKPRWTSLALAAAVTTLCVSSMYAQQVDIKPTAKPKRDKYVITAAEIAERQELTNAYEVVKFLRPEYLKTSRPTGALAGRSSLGGTPSQFDLKPPSRDGSTSPATTPSGSSSAPMAGSERPTGSDGGFGSTSGDATGTKAVLYIDDVRQVAIEELKTVRAAEILEIRYLTGNQALSRYALGHEGGAILLKTNRIRTR